MTETTTTAGEIDLAALAAAADAVDGAIAALNAHLGPETAEALHWADYRLDDCRSALEAARRQARRLAAEVEIAAADTI